MQKLADALNVSEEILRQTLANKKSSPTASTDSVSQPAEQKIVKDRNQMLYEQILAIALKYPINITHLIDNVEPEIISWDSVRLNINPEVSTVTRSVEVGSGTSAVRTPVIATRNTNTTLTVQDGEVITIGGLTSS